MGMWGIKHIQYNKKEKEPEIKNGFYVLEKEHIEKYREIFTTLPPSTKKHGRLVYALSSGIPVEYFVDTGVINENNITDLELLDLTMEQKNKFINYVEYKKNKTTGVVSKGKSSNRDENKKINICILTDESVEYEKIKEKFKNYDDIGIYNAYSEKTIQDIMGIDRLIFLAEKNVREHLSEYIKLIQEVVRNSDLDIKFIDLGNNLDEDNNTYIIEELSEEFIRHIKDNIWEEQDEIDTVEEQEKIEVEKEKVEEEEEKVRVEEVTDNEIEKQDKINVVDEIEEQEVIEEINDKFEELNEELKNQETQYKLQINNEEQEEILKLNKHIDELKAELIELQQDIINKQKDIETNMEIIQLKDTQINTFKEKLNFVQEQYKNSVTVLKMTRDKLSDVNSNLLETREENRSLREIEDKYNKIKDEYIELKHYKENQDEIVRGIKDEYELKIQEYINIAKASEESFKELQDSFTDFYEGADVYEDIHYCVKSNVPTLYFKILSEPRFFYSFIKYIRTKFKKERKKLLTIAFKEISKYEKGLWEDWVEIRSVEDVTDIENYDNKILVNNVGKLEVNRLQKYTEDYDVIVVLDFTNKEKNYMDNHKLVEIFTVSKSKLIKDCDISGNILTEGEGSVVDINYDPQVEKYTNEKVKQRFFEKRYNPWLEKVLGDLC